MSMDQDPTGDDAEKANDDVEIEVALALTVMLVVAG